MVPPAQAVRARGAQLAAVRDAEHAEVLDGAVAAMPQRPTPRLP